MWSNGTPHTRLRVVGSKVSVMSRTYRRLRSSLASAPPMHQPTARRTISWLGLPLRAIIPPIRFARPRSNLGASADYLDTVAENPSRRVQANRVIPRSVPLPDKVRSASDRRLMRHVPALVSTAVALLRSGRGRWTQRRRGTCGDGWTNLRSTRSRPAAAIAEESRRVAEGTTRSCGHPSFVFVTAAGCNTVGGCGPSPCLSASRLGCRITRCRGRAPILVVASVERTPHRRALPFWRSVLRRQRSRPRHGATESTAVPRPNAAGEGPPSWLAIGT